jgi:hypothetical protein
METHSDLPPDVEQALRNLCAIAANNGHSAEKVVAALQAFWEHGDLLHEGSAVMDRVTGQCQRSREIFDRLLQNVPGVMEEAESAVSTYGKI